MHKNYFFWLHLVFSLDQKLRNRKIIDIYSQNRDELICAFSDTEGGENNSMVISLLPGREFILPAISGKKKINSVNLFDELKGKTIEKIRLLKGKRIISIQFVENGFLWITPYGRNANIIFKEDDQIRYFKQNKMTRPWLEPEFDYKKALEQNEIFADEQVSFKQIQAFCPVINSRMFREAVYQVEKGKEKNIIVVLSDLLDEMEHRPGYFIYHDDDFDNFLSLIPVKSSGFAFETYNDPESALKAFYFYFEYRRRTTARKKEALQALKAEIDHLKDALHKMKSIDIDEEKRKQYQKYGDLLKANLYRIKKGMTKITVEDFFLPDMPEIDIPLKKKLNPEENARYYYEKLNNFEKNKTILIHRIKQTENKIIMQEKNVAAITAETDFRKLNRMLNTKKPSTENEKTGEPLTGIRKYEHPDGWQILVGKDDRVNDRLTFKIAKNKDIWLHAHGVPGSHVVIVNRDSKQDVPKEIIKEAAQYAAFFSKAKNAGTVPVIYTEVRYVRKPKGAKPGTVTCQREKTVFVKPKQMP